MKAILLVIMIGAMFLAGCSAATPAAQKLTAEGVVSQLKAAGLPIGQTAVFTADTDPNKLLGRPSQYISKVGFDDNRLSKNTGGSIEVFANTDDLKQRQTYMELISKSAPMFNMYIYSKGLALLTLSHSLTPDQAAEYQQALDKVK